MTHVWLTEAQLCENEHSINRVCPLCCSELHSYELSCTNIIKRIFFNTSPQRVRIVLPQAINDCDCFEHCMLRTPDYSFSHLSTQDLKIWLAASNSRPSAFSIMSKAVPIALKGAKPYRVGEVRQKLPDIRAFTHKPTIPVEIAVKSLLTDLNEQLS